MILRVDATSRAPTMAKAETSSGKNLPASTVRQCRLKLTLLTPGLRSTSALEMFTTHPSRISLSKSLSRFRAGKTTSTSMMALATLVVFSVANIPTWSSGMIWRPTRVPTTPRCTAGIPVDGRNLIMLTTSSTDYTSSSHYANRRQMKQLEWRGDKYTALGTARVIKIKHRRWLSIGSLWYYIPKIGINANSSL